ncbi:endoplasmic reticulum metallopeptidase 1-like isoform X2 [Drosophila hydei]|uniref:FXNA-like protease n=1 Tax=Drosophila hydei TaxID=7224 RepID=A0A6J1LX64_DROHY|nr:endoplasmic reticulum metallopeptidase 1-like isoform X2 [Drosophila hydei]
MLNFKRKLTIMDNISFDLAEKDNPRKKMPWYHAFSFLFLWAALFFAVVFPLYNVLPISVNIDEEIFKPGQFVAERAQHLLLELDRLGPKIIGDVVNEKTMIDFLLREMDIVHRVMRHDLYDLEVDVQQVSGSYLHLEIVRMYQAVQNVVVKLSSKKSNSTSYLLVNSHYDTKPGSVGVGDAGSMVVTMLEVLRQLATSSDPFEHPIVFLFNGAEESSLQGAHGFITQHRWSPSCKAFINLDSVGSGGREILFRGGPNHRWLMSHYKAAAKHPFATTMAEEIFQTGVIKSNTDFKIFRDFGRLPGLDMVIQYNGYVYHTKYDRFEFITRESLQNTGDNVLSLVKSLSNSKEMQFTQTQSNGESVYFDFLGLFFVTYPEYVAMVVNTIVCGGGIVLLYISLWYVSKKLDYQVAAVAVEFGSLFLLELVSIFLAVGLPMLMAIFYDAGNRTMTYFTNSWLVVGLFIIPSVIGLVLPLTLYLVINRSDKIPHSYRLQMANHAHCLFIALLCIILTIFSVRSAYILMISVLFYVAALSINLITKLHDRGYFWSLVLCTCQLIPFLYFSYLFYAFLIIAIPMTGRNGTETNPDVVIAFLCALGTIMALAFLVPLINVFRYPIIIIGGLTCITFIFCMISVSEMGFPYRPRTNVMRVNFLQVHRKFFKYNGSVSEEDSGYYIALQDRRREQPLREKLDLTGLLHIENICDNLMNCGVPSFGQGWSGGRWLPRKAPVTVPGVTTLELLSKTILESNYSIRYYFKLTGPAHMTIFVNPLDGVRLVDWSFLRGVPDCPAKCKPPYQIYFSWGADSSPINFYLEFTKTSGKFKEPVFEIGISGHYRSYVHKRDSQSARFIKQFPDFVHTMEWPASYDSYIF